MGQWCLCSEEEQEWLGTRVNVRALSLERISGSAAGVMWLGGWQLEAPTGSNATQIPVTRPKGPDQFKAPPLVTPTAARPAPQVDQLS